MKLPKAATENNVPVRYHARVTSFGKVISPTETLRALDVGQSFLVDDKRGRACVANTAYRLDIKVRTAKEGERFRIWRTE
jgi:hypothetical protein